MVFHKKKKARELVKCGIIRSAVSPVGRRRAGDKGIHTEITINKTGALINSPTRVDQAEFYTS